MIKDNSELLACRCGNDDVNDTHIALSKEALATLVRLYKKNPNGTDIFPERIITKWIVTEVESTESKGE